MIDVVLTISIIAVVISFLLSIFLYDDIDTGPSSVFVALLVIISAGIYIITNVNYPEFYSSLAIFIIGLGLVTNIIIIVVAIILFIIGIIIERAYIYMSIVALTTYMYSPIVLIVAIILGFIMALILEVIDGSSLNYVSSNSASDDSSDYSSYDFSDYGSASSDDNLSSSYDTDEDDTPNSFNRRGADGNVSEYYLKGVDGSYTGSNGNVIMKDAVGGGYHALDGSVSYYRDRYGDYVGTDGSHYTYDRYGDLVCDNGDRLTKD